MRDKFWEKLASEQRSFKWFYDNYVKGKRDGGLAYNTLYQQAKGEILTNMNDALKAAINSYLGVNEKGKLDSSG